MSSYDVYLSLISDPAKSPLFSTDNLKENFIDVGDLEYNQIYYWRVDIHDACGNVSQSPVWYFITGGPAIPPRPENLNIQLLQNSDIKLIWSGGYIDGGGYDVERKEENGSYKFISSVALPEFFLDTNLSAGVKYYYRVKAHNISGSSDYSNEESIIIPLANTQVTNPILKIEPLTIVNGSRITFTGEVQNAIPGSDIKFYLQRPDGSMKENGTIVL